MSISNLNPTRISLWKDVGRWRSNQFDPHFILNVRFSMRLGEVTSRPIYVFPRNGDWTSVKRKLLTRNRGR